MQDHVKLEVSLEIIMAEIAKGIAQLQKNEISENEKKLENLIRIQDEAYKGNFEYVNKILERSFE